MHSLGREGDCKLDNLESNARIGSTDCNHLKSYPEQNFETPCFQPLLYLGLGGGKFQAEAMSSGDADEDFQMDSPWTAPRGP